MDATAFAKWAEERAASDDKIDKVISIQVINLVNSAEENNELIDLLSRKHGDSRIGRSPNVNRDHAAGHERIWRDYFSNGAIYSAYLFRRRFRMRKHVFMSIHDAVLAECPYFQQRPDAVGRLGLSSIQKMTTALRLLTLGIAGDAIDEFVRIGESTTIEALKNSAQTIVHVFAKQYLREPTKEDVRRHIEVNRARGWVGMFGSLDCTHRDWKNCPVALQG